jgi:1-acyl-sn-glycerol-3-phosphate acyltransferase
MFPYSQSQVKNFLSRVFHRVRYQVEGIEHVPEKGPAVIIMNHTGWEEILLTILVTPRPLKIVGMRELIYFDEAQSLERVFDTGYARDFSPFQRHLVAGLGKLLGKIIRRQCLEFGYIPTRIYTETWRPVLGSNGIREIIKTLEEGNLVLIFPEGGYRRDGVMRPFKRGLGLLIRLLGRRGMQVPVIPAAQRTVDSISTRLNNRYLPRLVFGTPVMISFDGEEPVTFDQNAVRELQDRVSSLLPRVWPDHPLQTYSSENQFSVFSFQFSVRISPRTEIGRGSKSEL